MNYSCANMQCYSNIRDLTIDNEITKVTLFLYTDSILLLILSIYWELRISIFAKILSKLQRDTTSKPLLTLEDEPLLFEYMYGAEDISVTNERNSAKLFISSQQTIPLKTQDLCKKYNSKAVLNNLNLTIQEGG